MSVTGSGPLVFVSYSRDDRDICEKLTTMLAPLVRDDRLSLWVDDRINVGDRWDREIRGAAERSQLAVLLISPDFLASSYILDVELPALRTAGAVLGPVLVRDCLWEDVGWLTELQFAHDPGRDGSLETKPRQLVQVCRRIRDLLPVDHSEIAPDDKEARAVDPPPRQPAAVAEPAGRPGVLDGVPELPASHVDRPNELTALRAAVLSDAATTGITGKSLGLWGQGGIGKTELAVSVARDDVVRRAFPDGVLWVTVGEYPNLLGLQSSLLERLGSDAVPSSVNDARRALTEELAARRVLVVVDDVWSTAAAEAFNAVGDHGRVLYTTRNPRVLDSIGTRLEPIDVLSEDIATRLLAETSGIAQADLSADVLARVWGATDRVALAVALVGATVRTSGLSIGAVADRLDADELGLSGHPYADTFRAMRIAVEALGGDLREAYADLVAFPQATPIPVATIARVWAHTRSLDAATSREMVARLDARKLLRLDGETVGFHDLQLEYLVLVAASVPIAHEQLIASYDDSVETDDGGRIVWASLPADEPYLWPQLAGHLRAAGRFDELERTVTDARYIVARISQGRARGIEHDLEVTAQVAPSESPVHPVGRRLRQVAHLLDRAIQRDAVAATVVAQMHQVVDRLSHVDAVAGEWINDPTSDRLIRTLDGRLKPRWTTGDRGPLGRTIEGHTDCVRDVAWRPDNGQLASVGDDASLRIWDPITGIQTNRHSHPDRVTAVAWSFDGTRLATTCADRLVRIWDATTHLQTHELIGHTDVVWAVAWAPNNTHLATGGLDGVVRIWEAASGTQSAQLVGQHDAISEVAWSPDGTCLASASWDGTVRIWQPLAGTRASVLAAHASRVRTVAWSPNGRQVLTAGDDRTARIWDAVTGAQIHSLTGHSDWVTAAAWSPDGARLATGGADNTARIWDSGSSANVQVFKGHFATLWSMSWSPSGVRLATASADHTVRIWDLTSSESIVSGGHTSAVWAIAWSPDGTAVAAGGNDGGVGLWRSDNGTRVRELTGHTRRVWAVAWSSASSLLATASDDGSVRIWDPKAGVQIQELVGHTEGVTTVYWSPNGTRVTSGSNDNTVKIWDPATGAVIHEFVDHAGWLAAVAQSPDGLRLATAGGDSMVRIWNPRTGILVQDFPCDTDWVTALAWSPDSDRLVAARQGGVIEIRDSNSGEQIGKFLGHTDEITALAWSRDGTRLASASDDDTVRIWDVGGKTQVNEFADHIGRVWDVAWSPDGTCLASITSGGLLRVAIGDQKHPVDLIVSEICYAVAFDLTGSLISVGTEHGVSVLEVAP